MSTLKVNTIESVIHSDNKVLGSTDSATGLFNFPNPMPVTDSHHKGHVVQFHHYTVYTKNDQGVLIMLPSNNIKSALKVYKSLISNKKFNSSKIIDLRLSERVILTNE